MRVGRILLSDAFDFGFRWMTASKRRVNGVGQECPTHTVSGLQHQPVRCFFLYCFSRVQQRKILSLTPQGY